MALPIYAKFYQKLNSDPEFKEISGAKFSKLPEELEKKVDCNPIREEFKFWEWLRSIGKGEKRTENKSDSTATKTGFFDKIKSLFKKNK